MGDLKGVSVVVTRAAHQADELCSLIEAAGGQPIRFPVTRIEPMVESDPDIRSVVPHLGRMDIVIFISPNAATFGLALFQRLGLTFPKDATVIAIGPGTARVLEACGLAVNGIPDNRFDSEALLGLPELQNVASKKILIVRGLGGREEIALELERRGGRVFHLPCYRREPEKEVNEQSLKLWEAAGGDVLLITSTSSVDHLRLILGDKINRLLKGMIIVAASRRIARHWQAASLPGKVIIAENASPTKLIAALKK